MEIFLPDSRSTRCYRSHPRASGFTLKALHYDARGRGGIGCRAALSIFDRIARKGDREMGLRCACVQTAAGLAGIVYQCMTSLLRSRRSSRPHSRESGEARQPGIAFELWCVSPRLVQRPSSMIGSVTAERRRRRSKPKANQSIRPTATPRANPQTNAGDRHARVRKAELRSHSGAGGFAVACFATPNEADIPRQELPEAALER